VAAVISDGRFLVIRRSQLVIAPGAYCFPGGAIEPGETEEAALKREVLEELSVSARPVRRLWQSVTDRCVHLAWWHAELVPPAPLRPNSCEVASVHWMTPREMLQREDLLESNRRFIHFLGAGGCSEIDPRWILE
jgi:8-oxo-dGTP pyrophosphatase MutT (NUDIX family)